MYILPDSEKRYKKVMLNTVEIIKPKNFRMRKDESQVVCFLSHYFRKLKKASRVEREM